MKAQARLGLGFYRYPWTSARHELFSDRFGPHFLISVELQARVGGLPRQIGGVLAPSSLCIKSGAHGKPLIVGQATGMEEALLMVLAVIEKGCADISKHTGMHSYFQNEIP